MLRPAQAEPLQNGHHELIAPIICLHTVLGEYDEIVAWRDLLRELTEPPVDLLIDIAHSIAQIRLYGNVVRVTWVHVLPKEVPCLVGLTKDHAYVVQVIAFEEFLSQPGFHLQGYIELATQFPVRVETVRGGTVTAGWLQHAESLFDLALARRGLHREPPRLKFAEPVHDVQSLESVYRHDVRKINDGAAHAVSIEQSEYGTDLTRSAVIRPRSYVPLVICVRRVGAVISRRAPAH